MSIISYLNKVETTYKYRIKTIVELDDEAMDRIERVLAKYMPVDVSSVKKTIIQKNPLDFPNVDAAEVYIVDVELALPASGYVMTQELKLALNLPEKFVVVRSFADPTHLETERLEAMRDIDQQAREQDLTRGSLLLADKYQEEDSIEAEDFYGDAHTSRFLDYLRDADRADKLKIDPPNPLFKWMDMPETDVDAVEPPRPGKGYKPPQKARSNMGAVADRDKTYSRVFTKGEDMKIVKGSKE